MLKLRVCYNNGFLIKKRAYQDKIKLRNTWAFTRKGGTLVLEFYSML